MHLLCIMQLFVGASIKGWALRRHISFSVRGQSMNTIIVALVTIFDKGWFFLLLFTLCFNFSPAVGSNDAGNDIITKSASRKSTPDQLVSVEEGGPQEVTPAVHRGDTVASRSGTALSSTSHKMFKSNHGGGGGHKHRSKHHRHHHYGASKSVNGGSTR